MKQNARVFRFSALLPVLILFAMFFYYPFFKNLYYVFHDYNYLNTPEWVGLDNIIRFFKDTQAHIALRNTFLITICSVPIMVFGALVLAVLVDRLTIGKSFIRSAIFITHLTPAVVAAIIFKMWFSDLNGLINNILTNLGLDRIPWLTETRFAMIAIIILAAWLRIGYYFVIYLAGLSNVDKQLYESARIDGANELQIFFKVTLPQLKPVTIFTSIMATISGLKAYSEVVVLTNGAPYKSTQTTLMYMFQKGFDSRDVGYGATVAMVLFLIILVITLIQMRVNKAFSEFDG